MSKIQKTTEGEASFRLKEDFENEDKAIKGKDPENSEVLIDELKIVNIKYKGKTATAVNLLDDNGIHYEDEQANRVRAIHLILELKRKKAEKFKKPESSMVTIKQKNMITNLCTKYKLKQYDYDVMTKEEASKIISDIQNSEQQLN